MMINTFKPSNVNMTSSNKVSVLDFGASPDNTDNKVAIQNAIDYAATLPQHEHDIIQVEVPNGLFWVNGTIYGKSNVVLVGGGVIKATNNANFDYVDWGGIAVPTGAKVLYAMVGEDGNPIKRSMTGNVVFDYNGENQEVELGMSYMGIAIAQAEDCFALNTISENVMYEKIDVVETPDKMQGLCLFVAHAKRTGIIGGRYWKSGYDSIRIAGGAEDTTLINVFAGKAKRGAIQFTPDSNIVHLTDCTFDNREGGTGTSHAFFGHNAQNVYAEGLTLLANTGYCISFFADGNTNRVGQTKHLNLKNVVMKSDTEKFISINSLSETLWVEDINIEGIALTSKKTTKGSGHNPIYFQRIDGLNIDIKMPHASINPFFIGRTRNSKVNINVKTDVDLDYIVSFIEGQEINNMKISPTINAPNTGLTIRSQGFSDNVRIVDGKTNTIDSVSFPVTDTNIVLRDTDFREVQNVDKLRLVQTESVTIDNVLGA